MEFRPIKQIHFLICVFALLMTMSCSKTYLQFKTMQSGDSRYSNLKVIAINNVFLVDSRNTKLHDRLGQWSVKKTESKTAGLEKLVRKSLAANLARFSDYEIIDLNDFNTFYGEDLRILRPITGEKVGNIDFMLDIYIGYDAQEQEGEYQEVMKFTQKTTAKSGKKWITTEDSSHEKVVTVPYNSSKADLMFYTEVIKLKDGSSKVLKNFNGILSHGQSPGVPMETMINELGVVISLRILKNISKYSTITKRLISTGSDGKIVKLLEEARIEEAKSALESTISKRNEKKAADLYNLGICYEALGESRIAIQLYDDALAIDRNNEEIIKAIGELE
ncbi:hypothetical protein KKA14_09920 [bacterium]|nr:hypothetical protein [bacterium]